MEQKGENELKGKKCEIMGRRGERMDRGNKKEVEKN
jgi:hypothetical protein